MTASTEAPNRRSESCSVFIRLDCVKRAWNQGLWADLLYFHES